MYMESGVDFSSIFCDRFSSLLTGSAKAYRAANGLSGVFVNRRINQVRIA
jgi:hypothetical protein